MLHVGICDDDKKYQDELYDFVFHELFAQGELEFTVYQTGGEIVKEIEQGRFTCDLLFLDIHMPGKNGLEVAAYIREHKVDVDIIFVTVSKEHVFDGYTYNAFSYILKPMDEERMSEELGRYIQQKYAHANCLHVTINSHREKILLDRVYYFEADVRKIHIHQKSEPQTFYAKMGDLEEMLQEHNFIRCHQSYLVNRKYIEKIYKGQLYLENEEVLPVSRKYLESVKECLKGGTSNGINK
ncbi:MAG: LytTR family DNA-binding domain-containing protein [Lachnospiraceae bacterium]|nr:LytTR family DNA-binding domain-containing protein [Lachnospiraceae bacterium]